MRLCKLLAFLCLVPAITGAQVYNYTTIPPTIPANTVLGNATAVTAAPSALTAVPFGALDNTLSAASILRARDYGILPANSAATNDTGFSSLKTAMQASATTVWRVIFEPGTIHYTNNRWLFNVQNFVCECYGVTFQNDSASAASVDAVPLFNREMFDDSGDVAGIASSYVNGYLINSAAAGASTVTTTTAGNAANFAAGNRVMIYGYDQQQAGYPPNMRYFEEKTVLSVNAGTGVVTLTSQLQHQYDSRWWDTANYAGTGLSFGAPRILNLDRANYTRPKLFWFRGAVFAANSVTPSLYQIQPTADLIVLEDVTGVGINAYESDRFYCIRCKMTGNQSTLDKIVDRVVIQDSVIDPNPGFASALTGCPGVNDLTILRSKLLGAVNQCTPRNLVIQDSDIVPAASAAQGIGTPGGIPLRSVSIGGTRVFNTGSLIDGFRNVTPAETFTVGSVSGTTLQMTWNAAAMTVADNIDYGMTLTNITKNCSALVTGIYLTGGNTLNITQTGCGAPAASDSISFYDVIAASDTGGNAIVGAQVPFWLATPGPTLPTGTSIANMNVTGNLLLPPLANTFISGYASGIEFTVGNTQQMQLSNGTLNMQFGAAITANALSTNGTTALNAFQNQNTNINTGTSTGTVTIGGGSSPVVINSSSAGTMDGVTLGGTLPEPATVTTLKTSGALIAQGTKFTASGCSNSTTVGGATAGKFTSGTTGTCTVTITLPTATTGWACHADDLTTPANFIGQSASATGSCTLQGTTVTGDIIVFSAQGF